MTTLRDIYGPAYTQAEYLRALTAGYLTGWWDDRGLPAPWPEDFLDPDCGYPTTQPDQDGDEPPLLIRKSKDHQIHHSQGLAPAPSVGVNPNCEC